MTENLKMLLRLVVEDFITTGMPVGSQHLVEDYDLDVSSATIRNWLMQLEDEGYLSHPHTSSGRVPTESGYRFYLAELMEERDLKRREIEKLQRASQLRSLVKIMSSAVNDSVVIASRNNEIFSVGFSRLLALPEFSQHAELIRMTEVFDQIDEVFDELHTQIFSEPTALIGSDCPFSENCGSILLTLENGTLLGLLGSLRMNYARNFALLRNAQKFADNFDE